MLISEFARVTGLSPDTVRYYIKRDLLRPAQSGKGGRNRYQLFTAKEVRTAELIRLGQALGLSLRAIGELLIEEREGRMQAERSIDFLREHRAHLTAKADELKQLIAYIDAKIAWIDGGSRGEPPAIYAFSAAGSGACQCPA